MQRLFLLLLALTLLAPTGLVAQASIFGVRALGIPGRFVSARSWGMSGASSLFDGGSPWNPAALGNLRTLTASFVLLPEYRSVTTPAGEEGLFDTQFPLFHVGGPIPGSPVNVGLSLTSYTDREYGIVTRDTVTIRGTPTAVTDSFFSRGGMNDIRFAASYSLNPRWTIGAGFHVLTGSNRLKQRRAFEDSTYATSFQSAELGYAGTGYSVGMQGWLRENLGIALMVRSDVNTSVKLDSTNAYDVDLPYTFSSGLYYRATSKLTLATQGTYRTWSGANSDILAAGGVGSENTLEMSIGAEYAPDPGELLGRPIRIGLRYAQLPFPLTTGDQPREISASIGTGFHFASERGGVDLALERAWRSNDGGYSESAWILAIGVTIRPSVSQ